MDDGRVLILGCGDLGALVAEQLMVAGRACLGLRRSAGTAPCPVVFGDAAEASVWPSLLEQPVAAVLLAANPGLRSGSGDGNRVAAIAELACRYLPGTRLVYTGSTGIYGDAGGRWVAEDGPLASDPRARGLAAIETAVAAHPRGLVLRVAGITGPSRTRSTTRLRAGGPIVVEGDPQRPFSIIDERDLAAVCVAALSGRLGTGLLNCASPERLSIADYYAAVARRAGLPPPVVVGDGRPFPSRGIDAGRLHAALPDLRWRRVAD